jgi:hypothetical protein
MVPRFALGAIAAGVLALRASAPLAAVLTVDDDGRDCPSAAYRTIAGALAAAKAGDQITICAGSYPEQVVVTKAVRLQGSTNAVIRPTALPESRASVIGGRPITGGILVDAPSVTINGVQLDMSGSGVTDCSVVLSGIYLRNARAAVVNSQVSGARVSGQPGCESGVGVYAESAGQAKVKVTLSNDQISNCQKGGIVAMGAAMSLKMRGGQVVGSGPSPAVENGIQIGPGARGRLNGVAVRNQTTTVTGKTATGILIYRPGRVAVRSTTIQGAQTGAFIVGQGFLVRNDIGNTSNGIVVVGDNNKLLGNNLDGASTSGVFVMGNDNVISLGSLAHMPVGLWFYSGKNNHFVGVSFDASVPIQGQGVYGGVSTISEASVTALGVQCQTDADCDDGSACTTDACDTATGFCTFTTNCDDGNPCTTDMCSGGVCIHTGGNASCDDGNLCTTNDTCVNGTCVGGAPTSCDDGNVCTLDGCGPTVGCVHLSACDDHNPCTTDTCDAVTGCRNVVVPNGTPCPDGNACNGAEVCQSGVCAAGTPLNCDDHNPCTYDTCDRVNGCQHTPLVDTPCSDNNVCNGLEMCGGGVCHPGTPLNCDDGNACTTDSCNSISGCVHTPIPGCRPCTVTADCNDSNPCTTDACTAGACVNTVLTNGTSCADSTVCNGAETCQNGTCTPGTPLNCNDSNVCTTDSCDPVTGCHHVPVTDGTSCSDNNICNGLETCQAGVCQPGSAPNCDDGNPCTTDTCLAVTGCQHTPLANGTACNDVSVCNGAETCLSGVCTAGTPLNCDDGNPCTADVCDPVAGCRHTPVANGTACPDGSLCNGTETCQSGICLPGTALNCDDGNACTADTCNPISGCVHTPLVGCRSCLVNADCNDSNPCTTDVCSGGVCQNPAVPDGTSCIDGNLCNGTELCFVGVCTPGTALNCDDGNPCTTDTCDPLLGCQHGLVPDGTQCPDGNVCNGNETCQTGVCRAGIALNCNDLNPCTLDTCNAVSGCQHTALADGTGCPDANVCNGAEVCQSGLCAPGTPLNCDDGNQCTTDTCDTLAGCLHTPLANGTPCGVGLTCQSGTCR